MRTAHGVRMAVAGLLLAAMPVVAHHSFKAEYDPMTLPMTPKGTVTDVSWKSPHVHFDIDGKELDGKVTIWEQELGSPNLLLSQGWSLDSNICENPGSHIGH